MYTKVIAFIYIQIYAYSFSDSFPFCGKCAQLCPLLCNPFGLSPTRFLCQWGFSGKDTGVGFHSPPPLPDPRIEPMSPASPALQADSLPDEPSGKLFHYRLLKYID